METIAKKVVQNWAAKGYISDDEVEMSFVSENL